MYVVLVVAIANLRKSAGHDVLAARSQLPMMANSWQWAWP